MTFAIQRLNHPNVIKLVDVLYNAKKEKIYLVSPVYNHMTHGIYSLMLRSLEIDA
jgi:hypothetical protein